MLLKLGAPLLLLWLYHIGSLFSRLVFVHTIEQGSRKICFCLVFALSTYTFILLLADATRFSERVRSDFSTQVFGVALVVNIILVTVLCPLLIARSLFSNVQLHHFLLMVAVLCVVTKVAFGASVIPLHWTFATFQDALTVVISVCGVIAVGLLSGYAAITTPLAFLKPLIDRQSGEHARIALSTLAKRQRHLLGLWISKRRQIAQAYSAASRTIGGSGSEGVRVTDTGRRVWNWITKSIRSTINAGSADIATLEAESNGIQAVSMAVFLQTSELDSLVRSADSGSTWRGWTNALLGLVLMVHTLLKLSFTIISLLRWCVFASDSHKAGREDAATKVMNFLESYGLATAHDDGAEQRVVWVSVALNAWMITTSIRGFFLTVFRLMTRTAFLSLDTTVIILTTGMGAFFIGQMVLLRLTPTLEREGILYGTLREHLPQHTEYCHLNDLVFVGTSFLVAAAQWCIMTPAAAVLSSTAD
uniref:Golgi pH regulator conserved domain-containing protein n=1 Tax=Trypanosoma congolense (strain IL3000) TaxID=1068625 RepID=G0URA5_TRYCI|nr:conserved hypothetical protein [Trypanosoma congolense IL3000]